MTMRSIESYYPRNGTPGLASRDSSSERDEIAPTTKGRAAPEDAAAANPPSFEPGVRDVPEEEAMKGRTTTQVLLCCSMYLTAS
jgi:hypothetical protein